jgi:hypothetical protein
MSVGFRIYDICVIFPLQFSGAELAKAMGFPVEVAARPSPRSCSGPEKTQGCWPMLAPKIGHFMGKHMRKPWLQDVSKCRWINRICFQQSIG